MLSSAIAPAVGAHSCNSTVSVISLLATFESEPLTVATNSKGAAPVLVTVKSKVKVAVSPVVIVPIVIVGLENVLPNLEEVKEPPT